MRDLIRQIIREYSNDTITFILKQNDDDFVLYEFKVNNTEFFVRFYEKENKVWRRGYWYKEKNYFQSNIDKIKNRMDSETDPRVLSRLSKEYEYFTSNIDLYREEDLMGKSKNPLLISNTLSEITVDFLNRKYDECDVLEIQHMRKSNEDVSTRVKLTQRTLLTHLNTNEWSYTTKQSTSIIYKKDVDLSQYSLDIY
jgi:hypothetical protein